MSTARGSEGTLVIGLRHGHTDQFEFFFIHENGKRYRHPHCDIDVRIIDPDVRFKSGTLTSSFGLRSGESAEGVRGNISDCTFSTYPDAETFIIKATSLKVMILDKRYVFDDQLMLLTLIGEDNAKL